MKKSVVMLAVLLAGLAFLTCEFVPTLELPHDNPVDPDYVDPDAQTITLLAIPGVTVPAAGETPVTAITDTDQYTGTVSWSPADNPFDYAKKYTATITLTAISGYTLSGVAENFFTAEGATSATNPADSGVVTAVFPATGAVPPTVITIAAIPGVTTPTYGGTPVTAITETDQYTGTVSWSPNHNPFEETTVYTATITLTAKSGYTFTGVTADFFTVAGATSATNPAGSGVVSAVFPATAAAAAESGFTGATTVGTQGTITVGSATANMNYANNQTSITFPFSPSIGTPVDNNPATLTRKFFMSETQVTNALMAEVLQWAYSEGKFSDVNSTVSSATAQYHNQQLLDLDDTYIKINYASGSFTVDSGYEDHPVVSVTWYGAIMFCNWLTEMRDGNTTNVAYTGIDTTWDHAETVEDADKNGYRLPSSEEWEYAARYIGTTAPTEGNLATEYVAQSHNGGDATLTAGYYWTPALYPSGGTEGGYTGTATTDYPRFDPYAWYGNNTAPNGNTTSLMPAAQKTANQLGLYDMSGNVWEWCFTDSGSYRVERGGSWYNSAYYLQVGYWYDYAPNYENYYLGFRFARTQ